MSLCSVGRDGKVSPLGRLDDRTVVNIASRFRVLRQALRIGLHNALPLSDGSIVGVSKRRIVRLDQGNGRFCDVQTLRYGNKPGFRGLCVCPCGTIVYGEYSQNWDRHYPVGLFRSEDHARSFRLVHEFEPGVVRHIHFVQWDPFGKCLWMGTGDRNEESSILRSDDLGSNWVVVGSGSQAWRAVGLAFRDDAVYWGTDAGSDAGPELNRIIRWVRASGSCEEIAEIQGPCHGITTIRDGTIVLSTGLEGGVNEMDSRAHLWGSRDGISWWDMASWRKDSWPYLVQFGVIHFPIGTEKSNVLQFTALGLRGGGNTYFTAHVAEG
jgi:hypothetical protein